MAGEADIMVDKNERSQAIARAAQEKLRKKALLKALEESAGTISAEDHPEWATSEKVAAWVRRLRHGK